MKKKQLGASIMVGVTAASAMAMPVMATNTAVLATTQNTNQSPQTIDEAKKILDEKTVIMEAEKIAHDQASNALGSATAVANTANNTLDAAQKAKTDAIAAETAGFTNLVANTTLNLGEHAFMVAETEASLNSAKAAKTVALDAVAVAQTTLDNALQKLNDEKAKFPDADATLAANRAAVQAAWEDLATKVAAEAAAEANLVTAQSAANQAQAVVDSAEADITPKQQALDAASTELETARVALSQAKQALQNLTAGNAQYADAKTTFDNAKRTYDLALIAKDDAQAEFHTAKNVLDTAKADRDAAIARNATYVAEYNSLTAAVTRSEDNLADTKLRLKAAQDAKADIEAQLAALAATIPVLTQQLQVARAARDAATIAYEAARVRHTTESDNYEAVKIAAANAVTQAEKDLKLVAVNFLNNLVTTNATTDGISPANFTVEGRIAKILADSGIQGVLTNQGVSEEAYKARVYEMLSYENVLQSIAFIKECNELRAKPEYHTGSGGPGELKISPYLMTGAPVSGAISEYSHSHIGAPFAYMPNASTSGENLAWGYPNPFRGWYDEEKPVTAPMRGHYLSIIDPSFTQTGFAWAGDSRTAEQVFMGNRLGGTYTAYDADTFETMLKAAHTEATNKLTQAQNNLATVSVKPQSLIDAEADLAIKDRDLTEKTSAANAINLKIRLAEGEDKEYLEEKLGEAELNVTMETDNLNICEADLLRTRKALNDFVELHKNDVADLAAANARVQAATLIFDQKDQTLRDAIDFLTRSKANLDVAKEILDSLSTDISAAEAEVVRLQAEFDQKDLIHQQKLAALSVARQALVDAVTILDAKNLDVTAAQDNVTNAHIAASDAETAVSIAQDTLNANLAKFSTLTAATAEYEDALAQHRDALSQANTAADLVATLEIKLSNLKERLLLWEDKLVAAKAVKQDDPSTYTKDFPELVALVQAVKDSDVALDKAAKAKALADADLDIANKDFALKKASYEKAYGDYLVAKADYDKFLSAQAATNANANSKTSVAAKTPKTGDDTNPYAGLMGISAAAIATSFALGRRREE